jgi:hypothetical protein
MSKWTLCSERLPNARKDDYSTKEYIVTIPQGDKLKSVAMYFVVKRVRSKWISRWEWHGRISPWEPIHWAYLPEPPTSQSSLDATQQEEKE